MHFLWASLALFTAVTAQNGLGNEYPGRACGLKMAACQEDMTCVPDADNCADLDRCSGTCQFTNKYKSCGGKVVTPTFCGSKSKCADDPRLPPNCGMACDRPGICIPKKAKQCGGFAGFECDAGKFCYDVPNDGCDPNNGGADCIGICL